MDKSRFIDPIQLPFSERELYLGLSLIENEQDARNAVRLLVEHIEGERDAAWHIGDEVFAALALVSDDLRERVDAYMRASWEAWRRGLVQAALRREGLAASAVPTPSALHAADEEIAVHVSEWRHKCAVVAEWVRRRKADEVREGEPPPWQEPEEE